MPQKAELSNGFGVAVEAVRGEAIKQLHEL
jgi:hypothetical protein